MRKDILLVVFLAAFARASQEDFLKLCKFLPLQTANGRRLGTCCLLPGRHLRFFRDFVLAREPRNHPLEHPPHSPPERPHDYPADRQPHYRDHPPHVPPAQEMPENPGPPGPPSCDFHPLTFRDMRIGICCTFKGRFSGKPKENILSEEGTTVASEVGDVTTEAVVETTSEGYSTTTVSIPESLDSRVFINSSCKEGYVLDANSNCVKEF